jgi:stress-induced morphogen
MQFTSESLADLIRAAMPEADVRVEDDRGDGQHFSAFVVCDSFLNKSRVQQHQMVYAAVRGMMGGDLHALAIHTTPRSQGA